MSNVRTPIAEQLEGHLEQHRAELNAYCYRMLASPYEAEDAVQETFVRAWRGFDRFEHRASLRSWLYRIATNVCLDLLDARKRRARPTDLATARDTDPANLGALSEATWIEHFPDPVAPNPADVAVTHEATRLAFLAALQLPPRQRAVLLLREVLRWRATECAELLETTVASVNSALQRARVALATNGVRSTDPPTAMDDAQCGLLARYLEAFEAFDIVALISLIKEDATQSLPRKKPWLRGREDRITAAHEPARTALATASR